MLALNTAAVRWLWAVKGPSLGDKGLSVIELISFHRQSRAFCSNCQVRVTETDGQGSRKPRIFVPTGAVIPSTPTGWAQPDWENHKASQCLSGPLLIVYSDTIRTG